MTISVAATTQPGIASGTKAGNVSCGASAGGTTTNLVTLPCPKLIPGSGSVEVPNASSLLIVASFQPVTIPSGTTQITPSIDQTDNAGAFIGNLAFWPVTDFTVGLSRVFQMAWNWTPRSPTHLGDVDLGDGTGKYISLRVAIKGTTTITVTSSQLALIAGSLMQPVIGDTW